MLWFLSFINWATAQPIKEIDLPALGVEICLSPEDVQLQVKTLKECDFDRRELILLRDQEQLKDQRITNLEKEIELLKQEVMLKDRIIEIKDMEIVSTRRAFEDMKEISDRAIKLAETSKPKPNWQLYGILGIAAFLLGLSVGL
jgi:hypothetical protein